MTDDTASRLLHRTPTEDLRRELNEARIARKIAHKAWSRSDTSRFLNDHSELLLAVLRRRPGKWPMRSHALGYWLARDAARLFDHAHQMLLAAPDDAARERLLPTELL